MIHGVDVSSSCCGVCLATHMQVTGWILLHFIFSRDVDFVPLAWFSGVELLLLRWAAEHTHALKELLWREWVMSHMLGTSQWKRKWNSWLVLMISVKFSWLIFIFIYDWHLGMSWRTYFQFHWCQNIMTENIHKIDRQAFTVKNS